MYYCVRQAKFFCGTAEFRQLIILLLWMGYYTRQHLDFRLFRRLVSIELLLPTFYSATGNRDSGGAKQYQRHPHRFFLLQRFLGLVISLGSTLSVYPAASFPLLAAQRGAPYIIVNRGATDHDSARGVTLRLEGEVSEIFPAALEDALADHAYPPAGLREPHASRPLKPNILPTGTQLYSEGVRGWGGYPRAQQIRLLTFCR